MRIHLLLFISLCLLIITPITAQDDESPDYALRTPTAEEYLEAIPDILVSYPDDFGQVDSEMVDSLEHLFLYHFGETASVTTLISAFDVLNYGWRATFNYFPYLNIRGWQLRIFERWLENNPVDLADFETITFESYTITLDSMDIDGDGQMDWLLEIRREDGNGYRDYWVAKRRNQAMTAYDLFAFPVRYRDRNFSPSLQERYGATLERVEDVNADGKPEFVFRTSAAIPSSNNIGSRGYIYVAGWVDGRLESLPAFYWENNAGEMELRREVFTGYTRWDLVNVDFQNLDDDVSLELIARIDYIDNWNCLRTEEKIYDWDGELYLWLSESDTFDNSMYCALRQAEDAQRITDYDSAIEFYQLAIERYEAMSDSTAFDDNWMGYARERLVIAYALAGRIDEAVTLLDDMRNQPQQEGTIAQALLIVSEDGTNVRELCQAAYDAVDTWDGSHYRNIRGLGGTNEEFYAETLVPRAYPPSVGCNLTQMLLNFIIRSAFESSRSPIDALTELGVTVTNTLTADLNRDGADEWLIWFEEYYNPIFLVSDTDIYQASFPRFPAINETMTVETLMLPNDIGIGWVITTDEGANTCLYEDGNRSEGTNIFELNIWQLQNDELVKTTTIPYCGLRSLDDLMPSNTQINGWTRTSTLDSNDFIELYQPVAYIWDSSVQAYIAQDIEVQAVIDPQITPRFSISSITGFLFITNDYDLVLTTTDSQIELIPETLLPLVRIYRATALEQLNRPDEALAEYIAIYESAPESAWGRLARLHLEVME